jgi:type IV pilus assembly protein PilQ
MTVRLKRVYILLALAAPALLGLAGAALATGGLAALQLGFAPAGQEAAADQPGPANLVPPSSPGVVNFDGSRAYTGERISLDFQNADLHNIIRIIGEISGKNIVVSDKVTGKVTLKLNDVPWDQALDIVLASRNLGVDEAGNVLTIYDLQALNAIRADRERLAAERSASAMKAPLAKKVFTPRYAPIGVVVDELKKLATARGKIVAIGNDVYVEDEPGAIGTMAQIFMRVARVTRQVLIESRIVEAKTEFGESLGVQWGGGYSGTTGSVGLNPKINTRDWDLGGGLFNAEKSPGGSLVGLADFAGGVGLGFGYINKAGSLLLNARLNATEKTKESRTISAPRIMAANDQTVSIKQGVQIPFNSGGSATNPQNTEFKEAAMELKVTPHIEENGQIITLDINLKNDSPTKIERGYSGSFGGSGNFGRNLGGFRLGSGVTVEDIGININEAKTKLMVRDGDTVVIGGILTDYQTTGSERVPGLHRLPLLGWLFQNNEVENAKKELLIFITANIIPINL